MGLRGLHLPLDPEGLKWWWRGVQGLRAHVSLIRALLDAGDRHFGDKPWPQKFMEQLRQQESMVGHCLLKVLCVYKNQDDGFGG